MKHNKRLAIGLLAVYYLITWSWVFFTDGIALAESKTIALMLATFVALLSVSISVFILYKACKQALKIGKKFSPYQAMLLLIPIFAFADFLVSWLTTIIWFGPQGSIDNVQPLTSPALWLMNTPFKFASRFIGLYGLAAFVWVCIFVVSQQKLRKYIWLPVLLLSLLSVGGWLLYSKPNGSPSNATIVSETLTERVPPINNPTTKLVIFPEYGFDDITNQSINKRLVSSEKVHFIASKQISTKDAQFGHRNVLLFGNTTDGTTKEQDKHRLIPGGEDLSYIGASVLKLAQQDDAMKYFLTARSVNKGKEDLRSYHMDEVTVVGAAVCSSIISTRDYRKLVKSGATVLTNSASLDIFLGSPIFSWQQQSLAKFMAIANSRYFLQSANSATAYAVDNNGNKYAEAKDISTKDVEFINNKQKTLYTYTGEWLAIIGGLIVLYLLILTRKFKKK